MTHDGIDLIVTRSNLSQRQIVKSSFPDPLPEGSCLLEIDSFALTANNITYGVAADMLRYWEFFPTGDNTTGRIPVSCTVFAFTLRRVSRGSGGTRGGRV